MNTHPTPAPPLPSGGWFWLDNQLFDRFGPQLGAYGLAVYAALARCANRDRECHPSYQHIADAIGCSRRQVIREMARLENLGLVEKHARTTAQGDAGANGYRLRCLSTPQPQSPPPPEAAQPGDSGAHPVPGCHYPRDSRSPGVVTETTGSSDWLSSKQDRKNNTQWEEDPENKQPPQILTGLSCAGDAGAGGGSVLFSPCEKEGEPVVAAEEAAASEQAGTPAGGYSLARFVQVTGRRPSREERGQLAGLENLYTEAERCYLFDALESAHTRQPVRRPLAYLQAIAQRQARNRWPGLAAAAQRESTSAGSSLPAGYVSPRSAPAEETAPVVFQRFVAEMGRELYGSPMAGEVRGLRPLAWDGATLQIGVPQARLTAWLNERATPLVERAARQASPAQGVAVEFVWVG